MAVQCQFQQGDPKNIDEAIKLNRETLHLCPAPHPDRGSSLYNLAAAVHTRFEQQRDPKDIDEAIELLEASTYSSSSPLSQFKTSDTWARLANNQGRSSSLTAFHTCVDLLPQLALLHLDLHSHQQMVTRTEITSLASASATCAIGLHQHNAAVEFLQATRSVFWSQALHLRTLLDQLANVDPDLAAKLRELSRQLEQASFRDTSRNFITDTQYKVIVMEAETARCVNLKKIGRQLSNLSGCCLALAISCVPKAWLYYAKQQSLGQLSFCFPTKQFVQH
ncbi:hypothetical protein B0H13DRAFT_1908209 [Mycena leptocephala]|nr:hypothetical protein B0H13DRAFT_1908209 [Mycena leptocephala]